MAIETVQIKRGLKANLPRLAEGELALTTDTNEIFLGTANGNIQALNPNLTTQVNTNTSNIQTNITNIQTNTSQLADIALSVKNPPAGLTAAKGDGVTDDTTAIQNLINYASSQGKDLFFPNASYVISSTLTLKNNSRLIGVAGLQNRPNLIWTGANGGTVISTVNLNQNQDFWGGLENLKITYPCSAVTASTQIIYIARPYGNIEGIYIQSSGTAGSIPNGSAGIVLDGAANVGSFNLNKCQVSVPVDMAYVVAANHVNAQALECSGTNYGYIVQADSLNSSAGPPYNVHFLECHGYQVNTALFRIVQATDVHIYGGFNEGLSGGSAYLLKAENTFSSGYVIVESPYSQPNRIQHYGAGAIYYNDAQDGFNLLLTGQSNGKPKVTLNLARKLLVGLESGLTNGTDFTYQGFGAVTQDVLLNVYGSIFDNCNALIKLEGNFRCNTSGAYVTFNVYSDTQPAPPGGSAPNATATQIGQQYSYISTTGVDTALQISLYKGSLYNNTHFYACAKTSTGTVTVNNLVLTVELL